MSRKTRNVKSVQNMLDNHRFSDCAFLINQSIYRACRCVIAAASDVFEAMVNGAFQESQDRQIRIKDITYDTSFYNILAYVYGHELDFRIIPEEVLCEMLRLSQMYNLKSLYETLKEDLNSLSYFHDGSVVQLINTAKLYNMNDLYKRVQTYIYENSKYIMDHESFVNIDHSILVELLKSSALHNREIKIFRAVLNWIQENEILAMADVTKRDNLVMDLLRNIRYEFISTLDYHRFKSEKDSNFHIFSKYDTVLNDTSPTTEPRVLSQEYMGMVVNFTAKKHGDEWDKCYFSPLYEVKHMQWKLIVNLDPKNTKMSILLEAKPVKKCEFWECVVQYSFEVSSKDDSKVGKGPYEYENTFSLSESQHGNKEFFSREVFLNAQDDSFEIELCVKSHDPVFT